MIGLYPNNNFTLDISNLRPCDDRIILKRIQEPASKVISLTDEQPTHKGEVVKVGPGRKMKHGWRRPVEVQPGDVVRYMSSDLDIGGYILISEMDILVVER